MTLNAWNHPSTGQTRLYLNDSDLGRGDKVFFFQSDVDTSFADVSVRGGKLAHELAERMGQKFFGDWEKMVEAAQ